MLAIFVSQEMGPFYQVVLSFPTVIYTGLLVIVLFYWLSMALGLVDMDVLDFESPDANLIGGLLLKLGLNHVPVTVILTFIALIGWILSFFAVFYLLPLLPGTLLKGLLALLLLPLTAFVAAWLTAYLIRPLRPLFQTMNREVQVQLTGRTAIVRTGEVNTHFGEACVDDGGAGLIVKVRAYEGETFKRGERVVLLEKMESDGAYRIVSEADFKA